MTNIRFKDTEATLNSFHYTETYSDCLEGHPVAVDVLCVELQICRNRPQQVMFRQNITMALADRQ